VKVLVVDDEEDVRFVAEVSLGRVGGMTVVVASGGVEGLQLARSEHPDFILLDMMMPGMDGLTTFHALKADPQTADIPVIFLTAKGLAPDTEHLGAKAVILKPFDPMTLASDIRKILES